MRPFNILRACFFLLAIILCTQLLITLMGGMACFYFFLYKIANIGDCKDFTAQSREIWAEALAIVLALLLAGRKEPPDKTNGEQQ